MNQENITTSLSNEDKELLLRDLSGRLPYGVKFGTTDIKGIWTLSGILGDNVFPNCNSLEVVRPYLRSLSDLETERNEFDDLWDQEWGEALDAALDAAIIDYSDYYSYSPEVERFEIKASYKVIEWLCVHHIDYRGLIEKGLAIRVTSENNPYQQKS